MSAGADELRLASEHDRRAERARERYDADAHAWWIALCSGKPDQDTVRQLYQDALDYTRTRAQLADALGQLQRLHVLVAEMMAAQNAMDVFDRQTKEPTR